MRGECNIVAEGMVNRFLRQSAIERAEEEWKNEKTNQKSKSAKIILYPLF